MHVQPDVSFAEPADDPPEGVVIDVAECPRGHPVAEVVTPSPQRRVQPTQQVTERSVPCSTSQRSDLVDDRRERLLRRVGVDRCLAGPSSPGPALDAPPQEVEPLVDVADPRLGLRQAQAHRSKYRADLVPQRFGIVTGDAWRASIPGRALPTSW